MADLATDELIQKAREPRRNERNDRNDREIRRNRSEEKAGILAVFALNEEQGNEIIMAARAHWFEDEESASAPGLEDEEGASAPGLEEEDAIAADTPQ